MGSSGVLGRIGIMFTTHIVLIVSVVSLASCQRKDCGIGGCYSGQVINTVDEGRIFNALGSVLTTKKHGQRNAIGVGNAAGEKLVAPQWYIRRGVIVSSPEYEIPTRKSSLLLFTKFHRFIGMKGTEGLLSYKIENTYLQLVILWSITGPVNGRLNMYNVKIYSQSKSLDSNMYEQMLSLAGAWTAPTKDNDALNMQARTRQYKRSPSTPATMTPTCPCTGIKHARPRSFFQGEDVW